MLILSGSPVENSSTDILLKTIADSIKSNLSPNHQVEATFIKLNEREIKSCQACGESPSPKICFYDDIADLYTKLLECDCLLFGSPVYFDSVSAQAKLLIDRCNCFRPPDYANSDESYKFIKVLKKKRPGAMVIVGGEQTWFEGARRVIAGFFKWIEVTNEGMVQYGSPDYTLKGTVVNHSVTIKAAEQLGKMLANKLECQDEE